MSDTSSSGTERTDDQPAALKWHVWVARYDGNRKDHIVFGDSDDLEKHAPAIANSRIADVEHFGTFADFANKRSTIDLDLPERISAPRRLTVKIGRGRFWDAVWGESND